MDYKDTLQALSEYELLEAYENDEPHDIISEIADSYVDIYNYDLLKWLPDNYSIFEDSIGEFGFSTNDEGKPDLIRSIMVAQYYQNEQDLWETWNEIVEELKEYEEVNEITIQNVIKKLQEDSK